MSLIGIDFGSHNSSVAIWHEERDTIEVMADDLGLRNIPSIVAFRGEEVVTGESARSQHHKNIHNTFSDVRSILMNQDVNSLNVPLLEKELKTEELCSHFFRNIHNQVKQQVGKVVRDCIVSIPFDLDEASLTRIKESAQAGGLRIKSFIKDTESALLAHGLDSSNICHKRSIVFDIGYSKTIISIYDVSGGMFFSINSLTTDEVSGKIFIQNLVEHCAKDFQRKNKVSLKENKRAMMRLRNECEVAIKTLSTNNEAMIDIDSLFEGIDYSCKISRARFEDLISIPVIKLKNYIAELVSSSNIDTSEIENLCITGGPSAIPKIVSTLKSTFSHAKLLVGKFDPFEAPCIGAATHGRHMHQQGLLDKAPTGSPSLKGLKSAIYLASTAEESPDAVCIFKKNTVLPATFETTADMQSNSGYFRILLENQENPSAGHIPIGEICFNVEPIETGCPKARILVQVSLEGTIKVEVYDANRDSESLASLEIH